MRINGRNRLACKTLIKDLDTSTSRSTSRRSRACRSRRTSSSTWSRSSQSYREVQPFLIATNGHEPARSACSRSRTARPLRRHHQVHPLRRVHLVVPGVLDRRPVLRPRRDRQRAPVHLRLAATTPATCAWRSSTTRRACGAAAPPSTAPRRARAASRSPRRSPRSSRRSSPAASEVACQRPRRFRHGATVGLDGPSASARPRPRAEPPARRDGRGRRSGSWRTGLLPPDPPRPRPCRRRRSAGRSWPAEGSSSTWRPGCRRRPPSPPGPGCSPT